MTTHQDWNSIILEKVKRDDAQIFAFAKNRNLESDLDITNMNPVI